MKQIKFVFLSILVFFIGVLCVNAEIAENTLGSIIKQINPNGLNSTGEGGLYRFQGTTNVNNFICFGTSDKSECINKPDKYLYRIIGINDNGQLKVIKYHALEETYNWHSASTPRTLNPTWNESDMYTYLNGAGFLTNSNYLANGWGDLIVSYDWKYGDLQTDGSGVSTAAYIYKRKIEWTKTINSKIGLMYVNDYSYGLAGGNNCATTETVEICKTSWIFLANNDSSAPSTDEWTMSRFGWTDYPNVSDNMYKSWYIEANGGFTAEEVTQKYSVRPVFYITSDKAIGAGIGSSTDPFIIGEKNIDSENDNANNNIGSDNNMDSNTDNTTNNNSSPENNQDVPGEQKGTGMNSNIISIIMIVLLGGLMTYLSKSKKNKFNKI